MVNKVTKKRLSTQNRQALKILVESFGGVIMPCSNCEKRHLACVVAPDASGRCKSCVDSGWSCDGIALSVAAARKVAAEKRRLEQAEEEAEEELVVLQAESSRIHNEMNAKFAKITRLRRQRRQVESKGQDMIRRGLNSMDELERAERDEEAALEQSISEGTFRDWSAIAEESEWAALGLGDFLDSSLGGSSSGVVGHS
ncbi:hypothetical protein FALBO_9279 [Fusarium albosuccineum]|uniref:Zn(2)-C6 fungal-type domain-containing protein n=1 Tax=Fusarium albosuccineum TaxID=1237068 RepID=A0A8H4L9P0_9HYPO|nr:hypothetical protein FALBO_9279 [Fusarium albosuccineum]